MRQPVISVMFDARVDAMAKELAAMQPGELNRASLEALHGQTCRLLRGTLAPVEEEAGPADVTQPTNYDRAYGLPQESHEG